MTEAETQIIESQLSPNETLLWLGRPRQGVILRFSDIYVIPVSFMWGGFAIFWEITVLSSNAPILFKFFGVPFVFVGLYLIIGRFFFDSWQRKHTLYAVTNERVLILSGSSFSTVQSLNLRRLSRIVFIKRQDDSGTLEFWQETARNRRGTQSFHFGRNSADDLPMFEQIPQARRGNLGKAKCLYKHIRSDDALEKQFIGLDEARAS